MKLLVRTSAIFLFTLLLALILGLVNANAYTDVPANAWYANPVAILSQFGVIGGYSDGSFRPDDTIKRSEFLKMAAIVGELYPTEDTSGQHWAGTYWQQCYESEVLIVNNLNNGSVSQEALFPYTFSELEKEITRYEMSVLLSNIMTKIYMEYRVQVNSPANGISDYWSIPDSYKDSVEQAYGKGILTGFEDSSFKGDSSLTRAQAAVAIYRLLFTLERSPANFASVVEVLPVETVDVSQSFALRYASLSAEARRIELFGSSSKTYFTSSYDAAPYMVDVVVPIWTLSNGVKQASTATLTVHKLVAAEIKAIFNEIYNDPEQFPIQSVSGARFSDTMRHSWGCAIDINPVQNYYCRSVGGSTTAIVGTHWLPNSDPYSIKPDGSVVRAFAKYGWGWGGQGWSGGYYDYMHFSILSTGG